MRHELRDNVEEFLKYVKRVNQNPHVDTIMVHLIVVGMYDRLEDMVCEIRNRISDGKVQI